MVDCKLDIKKIILEAVVTEGMDSLPPHQPSCELQLSPAAALDEGVS